MNVLMTTMQSMAGTRAKTQTSFSIGLLLQFYRGTGGRLRQRSNIAWTRGGKT